MHDFKQDYLLLSQLPDESRQKTWSKKRLASLSIGDKITFNDIDYVKILAVTTKHIVVETKYNNCISKHELSDVAAITYLAFMTQLLESSKCHEQDIDKSLQTPDWLQLDNNLEQYRLQFIDAIDFLVGHSIKAFNDSALTIVRPSDDINVVFIQSGIRVYYHDSKYIDVRIIDGKLSIKSSQTIDFLASEATAEIALDLAVLSTITNMFLLHEDIAVTNKIALKSAVRLFDSRNRLTVTVSSSDYANDSLTEDIAAALTSTMNNTVEKSLASVKFINNLTYDIKFRCRKPTRVKTVSEIVAVPHNEQAANIVLHKTVIAKASSQIDSTVQISMNMIRAYAKVE
jgi:hypothetical protein